MRIRLDCRTATLVLIPDQPKAVLPRSHEYGPSEIEWRRPVRSKACKGQRTMNLKQTRLVTDDVQKLTSFYEKLTGATADVISSGYVEFQHSPCAGLAITSAATAKIYGEGVLA